MFKEEKIFVSYMGMFNLTAIKILKSIRVVLKNCF